MRWFQRDRRPDIWECADDQIFGDIGAAQKIREICASAASIAETIAAVDNRSGEKNKAGENERYQAAVKRALEIAMKISDDAMRDVAVSQIIRLSMKANHLKTARVLLRAVQSKAIQTELIAENPALVDRATA